MSTTMKLQTLGERGAAAAEPGEDVRGLVAFDAHGHRLGEVDDLIVDAATGTNRFLVVESSGLLGMLSVRRLIPMDIVDRAEAGLRVQRSVEHVRQDRPIAPDGWTDPEVVRQVCAHYQLSDPESLEVNGPDRGTV